ncbi:hypothetical protein L0128_12390 [candidate division KSB1 bacterium]|nr:hypothetical protein [candidate division KSB1 bacterium]
MFRHSKTNKLKNITVTILAGITIALLLTLKVPSSIHVYGKVMPGRQWILENSADGHLKYSTINYKTGFTDDYCVIQIERGEMLQFNLHPALAQAIHVTKSDTIGNIFSSQLEERRVALEGQLQVALTTLKAGQVGEKESVIQAYQHRLALAETKVTEQQQRYQRIENLYQKKYVSDEEYETAVANLNAAKIEVTLARAQLDAASTGEKREQIELLKSQITALDQEINVLNERHHHYTLLAPFSGKISTFFAADTLIILSDTSSYVVLAPLKFENVDRINPGQEVEIQVLNQAQRFLGKVVVLKPELQSLNNAYVAIGAIELQSDITKYIPAGTIARCKIKIGPANLLKHLMHLLD